MEDVISPAMREWARRSIRRIGRQMGLSAPSGRKRRGLLVVHLDGVPRQLLTEAVRTGEMPFISRLVRSGTYSLSSAFWGSPASTPAFQAGLLYGLRHPNLPAYNWFDRELGRPVRMNAPKDTLALEERIGATRSSLLEGGGTSYLSLFRGKASNLLCMAALAERWRMLRSLPGLFRGLHAVQRQGAVAYLRGAARDAWDTARDVCRWVERVKDRRHEREYMINRLFLVSGWRLSCARAEIDMVAGAPAIYLVYGNYDEVAHRRGPFSPQAIQDLHRVDAAIEELYAVARSLEQPYDLYILTDHGHVESTPFERLQGKRLQDYLLHGPPAPLPPDVERGLLDGRSPPGELSRAPREHEEEPVVIEAGNFSHVYLSRGRRPLEALELLARHRAVLGRAVSQPDIGIVALRRGSSAVAVIQGDVYEPDEIERAPLAAEFSPRAVADLLRELPFMPTAGDLVLYGQAVNRAGTVGFAWEFGSHGGLTRIETDSVICWPTAAPIDLGDLGHVVELHEKLAEVYRG